MPRDSILGERPPTKQRRSSTPASVRFISPSASRIARQDHQRLTAADLLLFVTVAQPGDFIVYHVGFLAGDRDKGVVQDKGDMAHALSRHGLVQLLQKRAATGTYRYILMKRQPTPSFSTTVQSLRDRLNVQFRRVSSKTG